jgi:hypothetical protein
VEQLALVELEFVLCLSNMLETTPSKLLSHLPLSLVLLGADFVRPLSCEEWPSLFVARELSFASMLGE